VDSIVTVIQTDTTTVHLMPIRLAMCDGWR